MNEQSYLDLLTAINELYKLELESESLGSKAAHDVFRPVTALLDTVTKIDDLPEPRWLPGCKHLAASYEAEVASRVSHVFRTFQKVASSLHWQTNPTYSDEKFGQAFLDNYAFTTFVGRGGFIASDTILLGVFLQGPNLNYPAHAHPAAEAYHILSGDTKWQKGSEDWQSNRSGQLIFHDSCLPHAMQTIREPLLALFAWYGDTNTPSRLMTDIPSST